MNFKKSNKRYNNRYNVRSRKIKYSYGVVCFEKDENDNIRYLMVKRRFTYSFCEFLYGSYDLRNIDYMLLLFSRMSIQELTLLKNIQDFDKLWNIMWLKDFYFEHCYNNGLIKYTKLKNGYVYNNTHYNLEKILNLTTSKYNDSEWGFPKGRREIGEKKVESALREFEEETGIENYTLLDIPYVFENHIAINQVQYKTLLYFVKTNEQISVDKVDKQEISDIKWFTFEELRETLRDYQSSIVTAVQYAENHIKNHYYEKIKKDNVEFCEEIVTNIVDNMCYKLKKKKEEELSEEDIIDHNDEEITKDVNNLVIEDNIDSFTEKIDKYIDSKKKVLKRVRRKHKKVIYDEYEFRTPEIAESDFYESLRNMFKDD